jgi:putative sterol carrier protein
VPPGAESDAAGATDDASYLIEADPYSWKRVLEGELDPIAGLMRGKLKLRRGSVVALARYVGAARELVRAAGRVETSFPEGWE